MPIDRRDFLKLSGMTALASSLPSVGYAADRQPLAVTSDAKADAQVDKRTQLVRLGIPAAVALYGGLVVAAHAWLGLSVWLLIPPLPLSLAAWVSLMRNANRPDRLKPALALTVAATLLHGQGMTWGFAQLAQLH